MNVCYISVPDTKNVPDTDWESHCPATVEVAQPLNDSSKGFQGLAVAGSYVSSH